jgi:hypothetical protein
MRILERLKIFVYAATVVTALIGCHFFVNIAQAATVTASPNGTAIIAPGTPPSLTGTFGSVTDSAGNVWSVAAGVVQKGGVAITGTHGVYELIICAGVAYQGANAAGQWWALTGATGTMLSTPPCTATVTAPPVAPSATLFTIDFTCPSGVVPVITATVSGALVTISGAMCPPATTT